MPLLPARCEPVQPLPPSGRPWPAAPAPSPPRPVLALRRPLATLYVELIQALPPSRKDNGSVSTKEPALLWVRPLWLQQGSQVWNLPAAPDLLWPAAEFAPAYAEEVLPLVEQAKDPGPQEAPARQKLQTFLRQAWEQVGPA